MKATIKLSLDAQRKADAQELAAALGCSVSTLVNFALLEYARDPMRRAALQRWRDDARDAAAQSGGAAQGPLQPTVVLRDDVVNAAMDDAR